MKSAILTIGGLLILVNLLLGFLLSVYDTFNMCYNTVTLALTTIMLYVVHASQMKDAFRVSLTILLPISGFVKLLLGSFSPDRFTDNWCVVAWVIVAVFEVIVIFVAYKVPR